MTSAARAWAIGRCGYWPNLFVGIGNRRLDMEAYIESDMLAVIVAARHVDRQRRPSQTVVLPGWADVGRLFATNHRFLSDPAELPNAISSDRACRSLVIPSREP